MKIKNLDVNFLKSIYNANKEININLFAEIFKKEENFQEKDREDAKNIFSEIRKRILVAEYRNIIRSPEDTQYNRIEEIFSFLKNRDKLVITDKYFTKFIKKMIVDFVIFDNVKDLILIKKNQAELMISDEMFQDAIKRGLQKLAEKKNPNATKIIENIDNLEILDETIILPEIQNLIKNILIRCLRCGWVDKSANIIKNKKKLMLSDEAIQDAVKQGLIYCIKNQDINFAIKIIENKNKLMLSEEMILTTDVLDAVEKLLIDFAINGRIETVIKIINNKDKLNISDNKIASLEFKNAVKQGFINLFSNSEFDNAFQVRYNFLKDIDIGSEIIQSVDSILQNNDRFEKLMQSIDRFPNYLKEFIDNKYHILKYKNELGIFSIEIFKQYMEVFDKPSEKEQFLEQIRGYLNILNIGSKPASKEMRENQYYIDLLKHIYPKGNYSSVENNIKNCEDRMGDLTEYSFPELKEDNNESGYKMKLTGTLGYKLKEGRVENPDLINNYSKRIEDIKNFIEQYGPEQEKLSMNFERVITEELLKDKSKKISFEDLSEFNLEEKFAVYLIDKIKEFKIITDLDQKNNLREQINDEILKYHYCVHVDLMAYMEGTRDVINSQKDQISKNFFLLSELNILYGEMTKQTLTNEFFAKLNNSLHFKAIEEKFNDIVGKKISDKEVNKINKSTDKFIKNISGIINNEKIIDKLKVINNKIYDSLLKNSQKEFIEFVKNNLPEKVLSIDEYNKLYQDFLEKKINFNLNKDIASGIGEVISKDYDILSEELAKYDPIIETVTKKTGKIDKKSDKIREVNAFFTKTKETSNARMVAHVCIAGDSEMWKNPNYFELVLFDKESKKCTGTVMLLKIEDSGKKYLWMGPNPSENLLSKVSRKSVYDSILKILINFAKQNGFSGIIVPKEEQIHGACTNRDSEFVKCITDSIIKDGKGNKQIMLKEKHKLSGNYGYQDCRLVWENK